MQTAHGDSKAHYTDINSHDSTTGIFLYSMVEDVRSVPPQYAVSESGTLVSVPEMGADLRTLAFVDRNGVVDRLNIQLARYLSPRLSPDGNRLAVQTSSADGTSDIWVLDSLRGDTSIRQLTTEGATNIRPVWIDGGRLAFGSDRDGEFGIYVQAADGSDAAERLTTAEDGSTHEPESWSPLHRTLSFSENHGDGSSALLTLSLASGAAPEPFFDVAGSIQEFSTFSPDGNWIAYSSTESGTFGVYPGFPTIFRGLSGFFVGDLRKRPCGSSWKTRSVFHGAVGALCASTAPSASTGPVRVRQNGSRGGNGELDRRRPRTAVDP